MALGDGMSGEYENLRRVTYGDSDDEFGRCVFVPVCPVCGRFVKADATITFRPEGNPIVGPTATCSQCGRVEMPCKGFL